MNSLRPQANNLFGPGEQLCQTLSCRYPVLQAGMGGVARAELVAAVGNAGGYGFLGMVRESPERIAAEIAEVRSRTVTSPAAFGVNLIPYATDVVLFKEELAVCIEHKVHSVCFFYDVDVDAITTAKAAGLTVVYQVGSVMAAVQAAEAGADVIVAQGVEAGGHVHGSVSTMVLVPQVVDAVTVPVVAAGGCSSGRSLVAAWALGAQGILSGTAFLATSESYAHAYHKQQVVRATSEEAQLTERFHHNWPPHNPVRVISRPQLQEDELEAERVSKAVAWDEGRPLRRFSTDSALRSTTGDVESLALFAGQSVGPIQTVESVATRLESIVAEADECLSRLACVCL